MTPPSEDDPEERLLADAVERLRDWGVIDDAPTMPPAEEADNQGSSEEEDSQDIGEDAGVGAGGWSSGGRERQGSRRMTFTNAFKMHVLDERSKGFSVTALQTRFGMKSRGSIYAWEKQEAKLREACSKKMASKVCLGGQGRPCSYPYPEELVQWIKAMRRDDYPLKMSHVIAFIREEYTVWVDIYLCSRKEASLYRLFQRFVHRHGYSFRRPTRTVLSSEDLLLEQVKFSQGVGASVTKSYARGCIFNADETAVYYDEEPGSIIAERGSKKSAKVRGRARSSRESVLLVVSATGEKLQPLIIFKGESGGAVEMECKGYKNIYATVQTNAWMDTRIWHDHFVDGVWAKFVSETQADPLALYVDNLKCHVSIASEEAFASWGTEIILLPKNTTAVLQPLDVGIMGPFKKSLRKLALSYELSCIQANGHLPLRDRLLALMKVPAAEKREIVVARVIAA